MKNNLKEIRTKKKMSMREFSKMLGFKTAAGEYFELEKGLRTPRVDKALKIAKAVESKVEDIWILNK